MRRYPRRVAKQQETLRDVLAREVARLEENKPCMVTGYVCIIEYVDPNGELQVATLDDEEAPYWRTAGLLHAADTILFTPDDTDEEVEDE